MIDEISGGLASAGNTAGRAAMREGANAFPHGPHPTSGHPLPLPQARDNGPLLSVFATLRRDRAEAEGEGGRGEGAHAARPNHRLTLGRRISARESLWDKVFGGPPKTARQRRALPLMGAIKKPRMAPGLG